MNRKMEKVLANVTITRVDAIVIEGIRPRVVGRNSMGGMAGQRIKNPVIKLHTNIGVTGVGQSYATKEEAKLLVGHKLKKVFDPMNGTIEQFFPFDFPLWDLAGHILEKPVYELLGAKGCQNVPVYDGSIYFEDLDPETGIDRGIQPVLDAINQGIKLGFRAFKIKVGRGYKWMDKRTGLVRDAEIIKAVRENVGSDVWLLIDANNGYTPDEAREVMQLVGNSDIFWFEEPFPESKEDDISFRLFLDKHGWRTLIADGEGCEGDLEEFTEIVNGGGVNVVQLDMCHFTLTQWLRYTREVSRTDVYYAPHNWGSYLGSFYIAHFCRGIKRGLMVECDPATMPEVSAEGYVLSKGFLTVPETHGFGLNVSEDSFEKATEQARGWSVKA